MSTRHADLLIARGPAHTHVLWGGRELSYAKVLR